MLCHPTAVSWHVLMDTAYLPGDDRSYIISTILWKKVESRAVV